MLNMIHTILHAKHFIQNITLAADISWFGQTIPFGRQCRSLAPSA